jgi:hypothetical protein
MPSKLIVCGLLGVAAVLSGCGGRSSTTSKPPARPSGSAGSSVIYRAQLSGTANRPPGAPAGAGVAIIALHHGSVVCWRFAHLHGFSAPTSASINRGAVGATGPAAASLSTGSRLHHHGCRRVSADVTDALRRSPSDYYVVVSSRQYPAGAVRGQL